MRNYPFDQCIGDPENVIAKYLREKQYIPLVISGKNGDRGQDTVYNSKIHTRISMYENGMVQPGVLVAKQDGEVLFSWAINPSLMNMGGATDRPSLHEIFKGVQKKLNGDPSMQGKTTPKEYGIRSYLRPWSITSNFYLFVGIFKSIFTGRYKKLFREGRGKSKM